MTTPRTGERTDTMDAEQAKTEHQPEILLVEDLENFYSPVMRWLEEGGYKVTLATSREEAVAALLEWRFHLAIIDIRLEDSDAENEEGMALLDEIEARGLADLLPCIIFSGHTQKRHLLIAMKRRVAGVLEKEPGYLSELMTMVDEIFQKQIQIKFDLAYDGPSAERLAQVAAQVRWEGGGKPASGLLTMQIRDLIGHLFHEAERVYLSPMEPGLTGAVVTRARPTWTRGTGPSYALKFSRREKVKIEEKNYEQHVRKFIPPNTIVLAETAYARDLGVLQYTYAGGDIQPLVEFDAYYREQPTEQVAASVRALFETTCRFWFRRRENVYNHLPTLYYKAFDLTEEKLVRRIREVVPMYEPQQELYSLGPLPFMMINPLHWLAHHYGQCEMEAYFSITHGDMTGRNIMVDEHNVCWLIDFYRTYPSHILRDFVILETDIKYRLLSAPTNDAFVALEKFLLQANTGDTVLDGSSDLQKAATVIQVLREVGQEFARMPGAPVEATRREYLLSLLMATLNVVRLRHIRPGRKRQALLAASLICDELG